MNIRILVWWVLVDFAGSCIAVRIARSPRPFDWLTRRKHDVEVFISYALWPSPSGTLSRGFRVQYVYPPALTYNHSLSYGDGDLFCPSPSMLVIQDFTDIFLPPLSIATQAPVEVEGIFVMKQADPSECHAFDCPLRRSAFKLQSCHADLTNINNKVRPT